MSPLTKSATLIFFRLERPNFIFFDDQTYGDRPHAPGGKPPPPSSIEMGKLVANQAVQHAPRLLSVDRLVSKSREDLIAFNGALGDLMKTIRLNYPNPTPEPGASWPLAVLAVAKMMESLFSRRPSGLHDLAGLHRNYIFRLKLFLHVYAKSALGKVANVAIRRFNQKSFPRNLK